MILGRNIIVSLDGTPIAGAKSGNLQVNQDFIEACSPTEARVMDNIPTTYDWSMSTDCLIAANTTHVALLNKLLAGTKVLLTFTDEGGIRRAGFAYIKSWEESGSVGGLATFSASFKATGALYTYTPYGTYAFTEGQNIDITSGPTYNFSGTGNLKGSPLSGSTLAIISDSNDTWVIYNKSYSTIKSLLSAQNTEQLAASTVKSGTGFAIYEKPEGSYCIVCNSVLTFLTLNA